MLKKFFTVCTVLALGLLVACSKPEFTVTFDLNYDGAPAATTAVVKGGELVAEPADPSRAGAEGETWTFVAWYKNPALTGEPFNFATETVNADLTLYAGWTSQILVRFVTKTGQIINMDVEPGTEIAAPTAPTKEGFKFGGWFRGEAGLTWLDPAAVEFPFTPTKSTTFYAYWEPVNSKAVNYSAAETYVTSMLSGTTMILNPLTYQWSHEDTYIDNLVTPMYSTEVDWNKAIADGVADYIGDFSKITAKEFSIEALDYKQIKVGATHFPIDADGDEHLTEDGGYDREGAPLYKSLKWTFKIREDLKFEDGTPIDAYTFEYSLKQYLDPQQNNFRSTIFYKDAVEKNGYPIVNSSEYRKQLVNGTTVTWESVGFKVVDKYTFEVTSWEPTSQAQAVGFANDLRLVQPTKYAASLTNGINSTYGTPQTPFVSYGPYILKTWDENQKLVFNKNYDYVAKETITYKSMELQIVDSIATQTSLFKQGKLSVLGLSNENYAEFSESQNIKKAWDGYPQYLILNMAGSRKTEGGHVQPSIMFDNRFRQALLYGFNRSYFATSVYAPNTASLLPIPLDTKSYIQDALYYSESPQHLTVLEELNIDASTNGYIPQRAQALFNEAYAAWVAEGNSGAVVLKYVATNSSDLSMSLAQYVESSFEALFGTDKLDIQITWGTQDATSAAQRDWDFDIALSAIGFGASYGLQWQYPLITFVATAAGAGSLGLTSPNYADSEDGVAPYMKEIIEVDLTNTYNYLSEIKDEEDTPEVFLQLLEKLEETEDKPAGIYRDTVEWLAMYHMDATPWDATAAEPFPGATQDTWNMTAAFERVFFEYVPLVPTVTRSSATLYADNVVITWPAYSVAFAWGAARYRYLSTDADFVNGMFNVYAVTAQATN